MLHTLQLLSSSCLHMESRDVAGEQASGTRPRLNLYSRAHTWLPSVLLVIPFNNASIFPAPRGQPSSRGQAQILVSVANRNVYWHFTNNKMMKWAE